MVCMYKVHYFIILACFSYFPDCCGQQICVQSTLDNVAAAFSMLLFLLSGLLVAVVLYFGTNKILSQNENVSCYNLIQ